MKWFEVHKKFCKPYTTQEVQKICELEPCYVLIEHLEVPKDKYFKSVDDLTSMLEALNLSENSAELLDKEDNKKIIDQKDNEEEDKEGKKTASDGLKSMVVK